MRSFPCFLGLLPFVLAAGAALACVVAQDLGSTGSADGGLPDAALADTRTDDDATSGPTPPVPEVEAGAEAGGGGPKGPGPLGALPSGYCCTSDAECRFRKCVVVPGGGGGKMCVDACSASRPGMCVRPDLAFSCAALGSDGDFCQPTGSFTCLDPATFERGTKGTGGCCVDTGDGNTGRECEANLCLQIGQNPWFCTRRCSGDADCPSDHRCTQIGTDPSRKQCIPRVTSTPCK